jgi:hypothetical protein
MPIGSSITFWPALAFVSRYWATTPKLKYSALARPR